MKQIILCGSDAQREQVAALFPTFEVRYQNGQDWAELTDRRVVCVGVELAHMAQGYAAECKVIPEPPADLTQPQALAWAKANAKPYNGAQNPVPQEPAPTAGTAGPIPVKAAEAVPPLASPAVLDPLEAPRDAQADDAPPPFPEDDGAPTARPSAFQVPSEDFGTPADLWEHDDNLPVIAPECYPDAIAAYVCDEADAMGCDPGMLAIYCTAICAGCVSDEIKVQVKASSDRWREPARVWCMVVGDSGLTMKSPSLDAAISHAWKIERDMRVNGAQAIKDHEVEVQIFEAQKAEYVKKRAKGEAAAMPTEPPLPLAERLIVGNATLEAIADVLLQQGERGALVLADELLGIISGMNQYKGGKGSDRTEWLEAWNGGPHAIDRKGRAALIKNWGVSIIGGTQPAAIARIGASLEDDGLLQRFSVYLPRYAVKGPDRQSDHAARRRYNDVLDRLVKLCARPDLAPVRFSPDASAIIDQARDWILATAKESWMPPGLRSHLAKWPAMLARYCLTYAAIEAADEHQAHIPAVISDHIAAQVWGMMHDSLWPHAKHFYLTVLNGAGDKAALRQIAGLILAEGMEKISTRTMTQRSSIFRAAKGAEQRAILGALCELGWLQPASGRSMVTGLPTQYTVNQAVHMRFPEIAERERAERSVRTARWNEAKAAR